MIAVIKPSNISGAIQAPASKSSMQRACAAALLTKAKSIIHNPGHSDDDKAALDIIKRLGATVETDNEQLIIHNTGIDPTVNRIECGESGLSIRMFTPIIALTHKEITIDGEGSLLNRPMNFFDEIFPRLGVEVKSNNGKLPITIRGPLQPKTIEIDGSLSSQFLTGLLMAYSAAEATDVSIKVNNLTSKPYIDLTLDVMKQFGLKVPENRNYEDFYFKSEIRSPKSEIKSEIGNLPAARQGPNPEIEYTVEGDWSAGAFLLVAGAIAGPITIRGLDMTSTQADKAIMQALSNANASFAIEAKGIKIHPGKMTAFEFDATDSPDLFPPLVALAAYCEGETKIKGVNRLMYKESDRSLSLQQEFGKMGVRVDVRDDVMKIQGGGQLTGAKVHSHHDHRIAMAGAVAALRANQDTTIEEADAVKKSYPDFYEDLKQLGANVTLSSKIKFHE